MFLYIAMAIHVNTGFMRDESALVACSSGNRQKEIQPILSPIK